MSTRVVLVRHGETDWNRERRFQGHADTSLNDSGRRQAFELADTLRTERLNALYTSPLRRATETARIIADVLGLEVRELEALREIDVGDWQGLTVDEVRARYPERVDVVGRSGWRDGETHEQLAGRVVPALLELGRLHPENRVLGVTHAGPIRAALMASTGRSLEESRAEFGQLENCAAFHFAVQDGRVERAPA